MAILLLSTIVLANTITKTETDNYRIEYKQYSTGWSYCPEIQQECYRIVGEHENKMDTEITGLDIAFAFSEMPEQNTKFYWTNKQVTTTSQVQHETTLYNVTTITQTEETCTIGEGNTKRYYELTNINGTVTGVACFDSYEQDGTTYTMYWQTTNINTRTLIQEITQNAQYLDITDFYPAKPKAFIYRNVNVPAYSTIKTELLIPRDSNIKNQKFDVFLGDIETKTVYSILDPMTNSTRYESDFETDKGTSNCWVGNEGSVSTAFSDDNTALAYWNYNSGGYLVDNIHDFNLTNGGAVQTTGKYGSGSYVYGDTEMTTTNMKSMFDAGKNWTLMTWFNMTHCTGGDGGKIFSKDYTTHHEPYYQIHLNTFNRTNDPSKCYLSARIFTSPTYATHLSCDSTANISRGDWHQVALMYDATNSNLYLYVNGSTVLGCTDTTSVGTYQNQNTEMWLGSMKNLNYRDFRGIYDETVFFNNTRTSSQILNYYENGRDTQIKNDDCAYTSTTMNTGDNHNQFDVEESGSGTYEINITAEGELFEGITNGGNYSLTTGVTDGNLTFNYTVYLQGGSSLFGLNLSFSSTSSTNEPDARTAITTGINNALSGETIYTDQQIYARYANGTQTLGTFDKVAIYNNKRWAFNYITSGESFVNMINMTPVLYVLEMEDLTTSEITQAVEELINQTK